jgi:multidrug efflux pump subunit AcrA (membrane-fusion protein)
LLFVLVTIVAAFLIFNYVWRPRQEERAQVSQETQERLNAKPIATVVKVVATPLSHALSIPGTTLAYNEAPIYARASGYLRRRLVDIGDHVTKGQLLAVVDAPDLDQQTAQVRSMLAQSVATLGQMQAQEHLAQLNWERYKVLVAKGVLSRQDGDTQDANLQVAKANTNAALGTVQANKDNLQRQIVLQGYERVTAPFSGVITARNVDVGALISAQGGAGSGSATIGSNGNNQGTAGSASSSVTPSTGGAQGGALFSLASLDPLRILVSVPEVYTPYIHLNQTADLSFAQFPGKEFTGKVTRTSASIDPATRTLLVEVQARNPQGKLMPGTYVVANFGPPVGMSALMIPGEAIVVRNGKSMVATVVEQRIHFKAIQLGRDYGDQTEVVSGLQAGDVVVQNVSDDIAENAEIEPHYRNQKADNPKRP